jgi:hypothetical protein
LSFKGFSESRVFSFHFDYLFKNSGHEGFKNIMKSYEVINDKNMCLSLFNRYLKFGWLAKSKVCRLKALVKAVYFHFILDA